MPARSGCVDRLLSRPQRRAFGLQRAYYVLQIGDGAGQAVDPGHHQSVALADEVQKSSQLGAALASGAGNLLRADHLAAGGPKRGLLQAEVLIGSC